MLVHICCSVDSHYFLQKLKTQFPEEKLTGFFYDPNIHPYSEYYLRLLDVKRSCKMLNIELIEGEYDFENWLDAVKGLENEPEKGSRCSVCFDRRFEVSAKKASQLGLKSFTSTLLTSPKKSLKQLEKAGDFLAKKHGISFYAPDYRKASGTQEQNILAKKDSLYRQDYCGCMFGLNMQRDEQNKLADELISPISRQIQPESIEERIELYEKRIELEDLGIEYKIVKQRFLNWRLKMAYLKIKKDVIATHILPYSTLKKEYTRGKIEYCTGNLQHMNRDEVKFITVETYNKLSNSNYKNVMELIYKPLSFKEELNIRVKLNLSAFDLSAIIVVDSIPTNKIELIIKAETYIDVKEEIISN